MRASLFFAALVGIVACGGAEGVGEHQPAAKRPADYMQGPPCRNWSDCEDFGCVVPASVPFGTEIEGVCYSGPFHEMECRRVVENGVVVGETCA